MNSKQRKIAGKIRERAELDYGAHIQKLESERRLFAAEREIETIRLEKLRAEMAHAKADLDNSVKQASEHMAKKKAKFIEDQNYMKEANVVRDVLLMLELDVEPSEIALNIRKKFGLLIPEW